MEANNHKCGVGVAHEAKIGGIKLLGNYISDRSEAQALQHAHKDVDVYSASWGPTDDGRTVEGPGYMSAKALSIGIQEVKGGFMFLANAKGTKWCT